MESVTTLPSMADEAIKQLVEVGRRGLDVSNPAKIIPGRICSNINGVSDRARIATMLDISTE